MFSREAYGEYAKWYRRFKDNLVGNPNGNALARMDTNLLKLSVIMRAQRYDPGTLITLNDFKDAVRLLTDAYGEIGDFMKEVSSNPWETMQIRIKRILALFGSGEQQDLWKRFIAAGIPDSILEMQLTQLIKAGVVKREIKDGKIFFSYTPSNADDPSNGNGGGNGANI